MVCLTMQISFIIIELKGWFIMNFIKDKSSDTYEGFAVVKGFRIATSGNKERLVMTLSDSDDSIDAVMWSPFTEIYFENGDIAYAEGKLGDYNNKPQITLTKIRHTNDSDEFDVDSLLPTIKQDRNELYDRCIELASSVEDKDYANLCLQLLDDYKNKYLIAPAAISLHHAVRGGLLLHTLTVAVLADKICEIYPMLNRSVLIVAALLHDIGKLFEIKFDENGVAGEYTIDGQLIGHIVRGTNIIRAKAKEMKIKEGKVKLLEHMILSHHGKLEYGSAVIPKTMEAFVLSVLDNLDASMYEFNDTLKNLEDNEFSNSLWFLDNRKIFRPTEYDPDVEINLLK